MGDKKVVYRVLMERSEGKGPLGRTKRRWKDNIKMGIQELGQGVADLNYVGSG